ncbi:MAG TPA: hypothetical protein VM328_06475, partial [Fimbriimonadaceae bacterium]|nr:hypothetical protein [Fimbriimonadaceae bacterium]
MIAALAATVAFTQLAPLPNPISTARYLGGGLRFRSQFEWKESAEQGEAWVFAGSCANECQGEKHFVHSSCDLSCDVRCKQGTHTESASANYGGSSTFYPNVMLGRLKGVIAPSETEALFGEANEQALRLVRAIKLPLKIPCWNETPCSY